MTKLSETPVVEDGCVLVNTDLGRYTEVQTGTVMVNSTLGDYSYVIRYGDIANATIGKFVNIASFVRIGATDHPMHCASQHHMLYRSASYWPDAEDDAAFFETRRSRRATVGHDVWIGHMAMIKPEVNVGNGAVVAMGAVVTKDVAPYTIVAGNPARVLRRRFPDAIAARLQALAWWDWDHGRLRGALDDFRRLPAEAFLERYGG
ncbi:MAG: chloramphenicol acetyltransferase [Pseudomonadota bacterium]